MCLWDMPASARASGARVHETQYVTCQGSV